MGEKIAGVLFDIGGVLAALDGVPSLAALLGVEADHEALHAKWMTSLAVVGHETGKISSAEFAVGVVADLNLPVTPERFLEDFVGWLKGPLPGATELLSEIPSTCCVAALSNMSAVHWDAIVAMGLADRFDEIFVSHQIGHLKPTREAFDGQRNVDAARALGFEAHLTKGPAQARAVLAGFGVLPSDEQMR